MTPGDVHYGRAPAIITARSRVLDAAYTAHPERFVCKPPTPPTLADKVWINQLDTDTRKEQPAQ